MKRDDVQIKDADDTIIAKGWLEFRKSGLLFVVNQFLQIFGWCICCEYHDIENPLENEPSRVIAARTKYRGFGQKAQDRGYRAVTQYMKDNSADLLKEVMEDYDLV